MRFAAFAAACVATTAATVRESIPFDYAWRFRKGDGSNTTCSHGFFNATPGQTCGGLSPVPAANTATACAQACCNAHSTCSTWQFSAKNYEPTVKAHCWIGHCARPLHNRSADWVGGVHTAQPGPAPVTPELRPDFDDSAWSLVNAPHDYIVTQPFVNESGDPSGTSSRKTGYFPRANAIYRKHFATPVDWRGSRIWLRFEGVYKVAAVYLNGEALLAYGGSSSAYTEFEVRLDNATAPGQLRYGSGAANANVLAIHIDGSYGTEHWYSGAGLYRSVHLERLPPPPGGSGPAVRVVTDSLYAPVRVDAMHGGADATAGDAPGAGPSTADAVVLPSLQVVATDAGGGGGDDTGVRTRSLRAVFTIYDASTGAAVASASSEPHALAAGASANLTASIELTGAKLWSIQSPSLYVVAATIEASADGAALDAVNVTIGVRTVGWQPATGAYINGRNVKLRGFCHHDDFTAVGMAMPDRVWLLRAQQSRGVGGNAWRMSHNNYRTRVYDILDALGTVVWDETRDLAADGQQALEKMISAHRNHPSVATWSFCNEGGCNHGGDNETVFVAFRRAAKALDPFRFVTGNERGAWGPGTLSDQIDLQGMSHPTAGIIESVRKLVPGKPLIASECCSCRTQRGEDVGVSGSAEPAFNADCLQDQVNRSDALPYVAGTLVWTLGDYMGEPTPWDWPQVSSSFGAVDLAGFPKAGAHWFQAWWLNAEQPGAQGAIARAGRPSLPRAHTVHVVESAGALAAAAAAGANATYHVYSDAPVVELFVNGQRQSAPNTSAAGEWMGWFEWTVPAPGRANNSDVAEGANVTAIALDSTGAEVGRHERLAAGAAAAIKLSIDAPSPATGTGKRVLLDGHDVALVRATIVDHQGRVVHGATHNVSFAVRSGAGRVLGVGNGDPFCKQPHQATWRSAYHGLARAVVKVTQDASRDAAVAARIRSVDIEGGQGVDKIDVLLPPERVQPPAPIVVTAVSDGLAGAEIELATSTNAAVDGVLPVAMASTTVPISLE